MGPINRIIDTTYRKQQDFRMSHTAFLIDTSHITGQVIIRVNSNHIQKKKKRKKKKNTTKRSITLTKAGKIWKLCTCNMKGSSNSKALAAEKRSNYQIM